MAPKEAPPPLFSGCYRKPRHWRPSVPVVILHFYRPNGEFTIEAAQRGDRTINDTVGDLENGDITLDMHLPLGNSLSIPCYRLVFNDMWLPEYFHWYGVPGVSLTEPNVITVETYETNYPSPAAGMSTCSAIPPTAVCTLISPSPQKRYLDSTQEVGLSRSRRRHA